MKITCEYCGSYVEPTENGLCPNCAAGLGESIRIQQDRIKKEQEEKERAQEEKLQQEREAARQEKENEQLFEIGKEITRAVLGVPTGRRRRSLMDRLNVGYYRLKRMVKRILIAAVIVVVLYLMIKYVPLADVLHRLESLLSR